MILMFSGDSLGATELGNLDPVVQHLTRHLWDRPTDQLRSKLSFMYC